VYFTMLLTSDFSVVCVADRVTSQLPIPSRSHDQMQRRVEILRPVDLDKPCGKELAVIDGKYV